MGVASRGRPPPAKKASRRRAGATRKPRDVAGTRLALIRAAERLFGERGVDAVSLREVSAAARQHNNSGVLYHFKSREGLIDAVLERHADPIQARYSAQVDLLEQQGTLSLRALLEVLVRPLVAKLDDADGGRHFVALSAQLTVHPTLPLFARPAASATPGVIRLMTAMIPFIEVHEALVLIHQERFSSTLYSSLVAFGRLAADNPDPLFREVFVSDLVDSLASILSSPPSRGTRALIDRASLPPAGPFLG